jgi:hypothetical protein
MNKLRIKAFFYQWVCFVAFFIAFRLLLHFILPSIPDDYGNIGAFVLGAFLGPRFKVMKTNQSDTLFMDWILVKGLKKVG